MATILIVDDLSTNRKLLITFLRDQGHRLLEAANGREALTAVQTERPDLVITDVLMPVMDGYEFVRQLRLDPACREIPVVFCTAHYGEREARALAMSGGVSFILTKPADSKDVLAIVGRALGGESETVMSPDTSPLTTAFGGEHLRLLTDKLSEKAGDLRIANARLRALINIGLELASERDPDRLLQSVCAAVQDLFGATYVTLGILDRQDRTVQRLVTAGAVAATWIKTGDAVSGILGTVVAERRAVRGANPGGDPTRLQFPLLHPPVRTFLAAPVASPADVYGWICLVRNEDRRFTENDEHLVLALSGLVGRIYENSYFYAVAQKERDRAQLYLDTADIILLALDLHGRITQINRKGCDLLGWTEPELLGRDFLEMCLPARLRVALRRKFHAVVDGDLSLVEAPILTKAGGERLIEWRNTLLRDRSGRVIGTFSSGADITDRNQAIEALRAGEERMRFALQSADVGIWDLDCATGVLRWSETLEAQYGLPAGTFSGTVEAATERIHPDDRASVQETFERATVSGADFSVQYRTIWPDGSVRWLRGTGRVRLGAHGEPVRAVGISQDVTERRTLEAQYQQAQKMEAIGQLAGGVAHDFNNLLTAILGYCELVLEDLAPEDRRYADVTEIQKAGESAAALTRQLLAFSRKEIIEPTRLDLNVVVTDMRAMLGRLIREDVNVVLVLRPGLTPVMAARGQVEQIVLNLAVNARDAMPGGGTLTIETADVELDEHYAKAHLAVSPGPYVRLTVSDTGAGMTPEVQARLFEPFFTTKGPGKGTGLGLATVYGIVTRSGGSVTVYSEVGRGTSFKVYFPRADAVETIVDGPSPSARPRTGATTVLVIEGTAEVRELTKRLLERLAYTVLVAANADEALQLLEQNAPVDLLLTDVVMPGTSGPELTRQLLERRPALKVLYMSGFTEDAIAHHGVLDPGIAFLHKPFTADALGRKIREVLDP